MRPRLPSRVVRHTRLPVWPAWQGVALGALSLFGPLRPLADRLESSYGGRVCPMSLSDSPDADPFILLVHHRHAFRGLDPLRPLFSAAIMPEGFPAHPHRGFETLTYTLPRRGGLVHRDSEGCKMRYGGGAAQWMTAGCGMLHEEMWDVSSDFVDFELYQLWVNLPPQHKMVAPRVQLLGSPGSVQRVERRGKMGELREGAIPTRELEGGGVIVRAIASPDATLTDAADGGATTFSPMRVEHVSIRAGSRYVAPLPEGWTCIVYVREGSVDFGASAAEPAVANTHETAYLGRAGGDCVAIAARDGPADVLLLAAEPIGAPVAASGTMVMNSQAEVSEAMYDYQSGAFGTPWDHTLSDDDWAEHCAAKPPRRTAAGYQDCMTES